MLNKPAKQIILTAAKAAGVPLDLIHAGILLMTGDTAKVSTAPAILVNQATAARLLSVSRFTIRRMVTEGTLHPVRVRGAVRYARAELELVARYQGAKINPSER